MEMQLNTAMENIFVFCDTLDNARHTGSWYKEEWMSALAMYCVCFLDDSPCDTVTDFLEDLLDGYYTLDVLQQLHNHPAYPSSNYWHVLPYIVHPVIACDRALSAPGMPYAPLCHSYIAVLQQVAQFLLPYMPEESGMQTEKDAQAYIKTLERYMARMLTIPVSDVSTASQASVLC